MNDVCARKEHLPVDESDRHHSVEAGRRTHHAGDALDAEGESARYVEHDGRGGVGGKGACAGGQNGCETRRGQEGRNSWRLGGARERVGSRILAQVFQIGVFVLVEEEGGQDDRLVGYAACGEVLRRQTHVDGCERQKSLTLAVSARDRIRSKTYSYPRSHRPHRSLLVSGVLKLLVGAFAKILGCSQNQNEVIRARLAGLEEEAEREVWLEMEPRVIVVAAVRVDLIEVGRPEHLGLQRGDEGVSERSGLVRVETVRGSLIFSRCTDLAELSQQKVP
jgi:hypothetical protein